jgi:hypothetical protein
MPETSSAKKRFSKHRKLFGTQRTLIAILEERWTQRQLRKSDATEILKRIIMQKRQAAASALFVVFSARPKPVHFPLHQYGTGEEPGGTGVPGELEGQDLRSEPNYRHPNRTPEPLWQAHRSPFLFSKPACAMVEGAAQYLRHCSTQPV